MAFDRTAADAVLKDLYIGPVREQVNQSTPLSAQVERSTDEVEGRQIVIPLHTKRSGNIGARAEGGTLPTARNQKYKELKEKTKYNYARISISGPVIKSTKSDRGSFLRALQSETKGAITELKEDFNRQLAGNDESGTGVLATLAATGTTTRDITDTDEQGKNAATYRRLRVGQFVSVYPTASSTANADNLEITATSKSGKTVTFSAAAGTEAAADRVTISGALSNEIIGLEGIVKDTGTLHGLAPGTETYWKATLKDNSGTLRAISDDLLQQTVDDIEAESGETDLSIVCEMTQRRKYVAVLESQKRIVNKLELKGGFQSVAYESGSGTIPFVVDRFVDDFKMLFVNFGHIKLAEMSDWEWADEDGAVLSRVSGKDEWEAFLFKYSNLVTDRRNAHGLLTDLAR